MIWKAVSWVVGLRYARWLEQQQTSEAARQHHRAMVHERCREQAAWN